MSSIQTETGAGIKDSLVSAFTSPDRCLGEILRSVFDELGGFMESGEYFPPYSGFFINYSQDDARRRVSVDVMGLLSLVRLTQKVNTENILQRNKNLSDVREQAGVKQMSQAAYNHLTIFASLHRKLSIERAFTQYARSINERRRLGINTKSDDEVIDEMTFCQAEINNLDFYEDMRRAIDKQVEDWEHPYCTKNKDTHKDLATPAVETFMIDEEVGVVRDEANPRQSSFYESTKNGLANICCNWYTTLPSIVRHEGDNA